MRDPYETLGVQRDATPDALKKAYRRLAKQLHPDLHPGDKAAAERFKEVTAAYDILSDPAKRTRFDRGEMDASGAERASARSAAHAYRQARNAGFRGFGFDFGARGGEGGARAQRSGKRDKAAGGGPGFSPEDLFSELFGDEGVTQGSAKMRGQDFRIPAAIGFAEAATGGKARIVLPDKRSVEIAVPPGTESGQVLRLKGQGQPGLGGAPAGDAYIEITVQPHPFFRREGHDVRMEMPVSLQEAVLGGRIEVPTVDGQVAMSVPAGSNAGTVLRLKGKGIADASGKRGDQYVTLRIALPDKIDGELRAFVERWGPANPYDPRKKVGMS